MILDFAARYFLMPNKLKYKNFKGSDNLLFDFCCGAGGKKEVAKLLKKYPAINIFLELIAAKNNKKLFDREVIEAYWLGNGLLKKVSASDMRSHIKASLEKSHAPPEIISQLVASIPDGACPHHSFHILHISRISHEPSFVYSNFDKCRINYGEVKRIRDGFLIVEKKSRQKEIMHNPSFLKGVKKGDIVAFHWDFAIDKITRQQAEQLDYYTERHRRLMG